MSSVFISYAGPDLEFASQLASALQLRIDCWFDRQRIRAGTIVLDAIQNGLHDAKWAILLISHAYFENDWTKWELKEITVRSIQGKLRVFPVLLDVTPREFRERADLLHHWSWATAQMGISSIVDAFFASVHDSPKLPCACEVRCHREDGLRYIHVPVGTFLMGALADDSGAEENESPAHTVTLRAFWMSETVITEAAFYRFQVVQLGLTPAEPRPGDLPRTNVNWAEARQYASWAGGDLPTEAQWEYAARGGVAGRLYPWGNTISAADANYRHLGNSRQLANAWSYKPNPFGFYNMSGNVEEWTRDEYASYSPMSQENPRGFRGTEKVVRGGSYKSAPGYLRVSSRRHLSPEVKRPDLGFRVVLDLETNMLRVLDPVKTRSPEGN